MHAGETLDRIPPRWIGQSMKISQTGSGTPVNRSRKTSKSNGTDADAFKTHLDGEPSSAASDAAAAAPLAALSSLLALQEAPGPEADRRQAIGQGNTMLDELTKLQIGLVEGAISEETLRRLTHLLGRPRPNLDDPTLEDILDEIEIRAAVELAKLEDRTGGGNSTDSDA